MYTRPSFLSHLQGVAWQKSERLGGLSQEASSNLLIVCPEGEFLKYCTETGKRNILHANPHFEALVTPILNFISCALESLSPGKY